MTTAQRVSLNAETQQNIKALDGDGTMLNRLAKYFRKSLKEKEEKAFMTKDTISSYGHYEDQ